MQEMEEKLAAAARAFAESSVRARLGALEMLDSCFEQQACDEQEVAVLNEALATVIELSFYVAPRWRERTCVVRLRKFLVRLCTAYAQAVPLLAKGIVREAGSGPDAQAAYALLGWSLALLPKLDGKMFGNQLWAAAQCLTVIQRAADTKGSKSAHRRWATAGRSFSALLGQVDAAAPTYMSALLAGDAPAGDGAAAATGIVLQFLADRNVLATYKAALGELYCRDVLSAKRRLSAGAFRCFDAFFVSLATAELQEHIAPSIPRAVKRGPDLLGPPLARMAAVLTCDASAVANGILMPFALELTKDSNAQRCADATQLVSSLALTKEPALVEQHMQALVKELGASKLPEQRIALAEMAIALAATPAELGDAASSALDDLIPVMQAEKAPEIKIKLLQAVGHWLRRCSSIPEKFTGVFGKLLKNAKGESVRRNMLEAALKAMDSDELVQQGAALMPPALDTLKACAAKKTAEAALRSREGVAAARLLVNLASADSDVAEKLEAAEFWQLLLLPERGLGFWVGLRNGLDSALLDESCQLFELILRDHTDKLGASPTERVYEALTEMLTHRSPATRKLAAETTNRLLHNHPPRSRDFLLAFTKLFASLGDDYTVHESSNGYECVVAEGHSRDTFVEDNNYVHAEVITGALTLATRYLTVADAAGYILIAHHPVLLGSGDGQVWQRFSSRCLRRTANQPVFRAQLGKIVDSLLSSQGLSSESSTKRKTANSAIRSLARWDFDAFGAVFMPRLKSALCWGDVETITEMDELIFKAAGDDIVDPEFANIYESVTEASDAKQIKKAATDRGRTALYNAEDAAWEAELRAELQVKKAAPAAKGRSKGGKGGKSKEPPKQMSAKEMMEMRAKNKLEEERCRRAELINLSDRVVEHLEALEGMILADLHRAEAVLHAEVLPLLLPFVGARLLPISRAAMSTLTAAVKAAAAARGGEVLARLVPAVVHSIALQSTGAAAADRNVGDLGSSVLALVRELSGPNGCQGVPLPPAAFACVFPALTAALSGSAFTDSSCKEAQSLYAPAIKVLALHTAPEIDYPRVKMLRLLLQSVLIRAPGELHKMAGALVPKLYAGLSSQDLLAATTSLLSQHKHVRSACLTGLISAPALRTRDDVDQTVVVRLLCARSDADEQNRDQAEQAWGIYGCEVAAESCERLVQMLGASGVPFVRDTVARAIALAVAELPECAELTFENLRNLYNANPSEAFDEPMPSSFVLENEETELYAWQIRDGVGLAFGEVSALLHADDVGPLFDFLAPRPLGDPVDSVKETMVKTALKVMDDLGPDCADTIFPIFEDYLAFPDAKGEAEVCIQDRARQSAVICLGGLAKYLPPDGGKPQEIMNRLLESLRTPSEPVQQSICKCLPGLIKVQKDRAEELLGKVLTEIGQGEIAERRGAAYGLAGLVKGLGLSCLKNHQIIPKLSEMVDPAVNKKDNVMRQGALWGLELLCLNLGRLFEPYVIHILPLLLQCFNAGESVRDAAFGAADAIMSQLSGQGVKLVLPALLKSMDESDHWRTMQGAIEVLGAMAHCAPRQLSQCLPTVVPRLCEAVQDTHPKVKAAAKASLGRIGEVIRNPEIKEISESLLNALADSSNTANALQRLMDMAFVHAVDAPSLAIIMPILQKSLRDRSTETKKSGCQIVGSMCSLISETKDMEPYLPLVLPDLQKMLMDHIPEVRAVSAKAIGSLIRGMGEQAFPTLVSDLLNRACPPPGELDEYGNEVEIASTTVERAGAAQGLSEVIAGLGVERFSALMPELLERGQDSRAEVREGVLSVFVYMPQACETPDEFEPYIADTLPPVLSGLADEGESVRDIALRAAKVIVEIYGRSALDLLLPALQARLFDEDWRIRLSAVQLLGDLLYNLTGASGKAVMDEDETGLASSSTQHALIAILGESRRNNVLGALYMLRSDPSHAVGHAANHVWKSVVVNPPKTLKEVMGELMTMVIDSMASDNEDFQALAGAALGDLVQKMGDSVLPMVLPILMQGIQDDDPVKRQGICLGLAQVITASTKAMIDEFVEDFIPPVQLALVDDDELVREAAAQTFGTMYRHPDFGRKALDSIVPTLLGEIGDGNNAALDGLRQIVSVKPQLVQSLIPKLVGVGAMSLAGIKSLAKISTVPDVSLELYINSIVPSILKTFDATNSVGEADQMMEYAEECIVAIGFVCEDIDMILIELYKGLKDTMHYTPSNAVRRATCEIVQAMYGERVEMSPTNHVDTLEELMKQLDHIEQEVRLGAWNAISTMVKTIAPKGDDHALMSFVAPARANFGRLKDAGRREHGEEWNLAGLNVPKGLDPFVDIYQRALLKGNEEQRQEGAAGLGELIDVTDRAALQKYIVPITGPLIRVFGDKFSWQVKAAILETFRVLIGKAGIKIKQFVPQLQGIFTKALRNNESQVRSRAVLALEQLLPLFPANKLSPLVKELTKGLKEGVSCICFRYGAMQD